MDDFDYPPFAVPPAAMDKLEETLHACGIPATREGDTHFTATLAVFEEPVEQLFAIDLRVFFQENKSVRTNMGNLQIFLGDYLPYPSPLPITLLLIVPPELASWPQMDDLCSLIADDRTLAKKVTCCYEDVAHHVGNPFSFWQQRIQSPAQCWVQNDTPVPWQATPEPSQDVFFEPRNIEGLITEVLAMPNADEVRQRVSILAQRILGTGYRVFLEKDDIRLGRKCDTRGVPFFCWSSGETKAMALCLFLVSIHGNPVPELCIRIHACLNGLDELKHYRALGVLRDFVVATGASVCFTTDHSANQRVAKKVLTRAVEVANKAFT